MKALILRQNPDAACETSKVLIDKGFQILCVETLAVAHALIRVDTIDLLVMDEVFAGQMTHALALSGERRSPYLNTIMLTDRSRAETDDLYDLIPCLYALAGTTVSPRILGQLALSAVSNWAEAVARVTARQLMEDMPNNTDEEPALADIAIAPLEMATLENDADTPLVHIKEALPPHVAAMLQAQPFYQRVNDEPTRRPQVA